MAEYLLDKSKVFLGFHAPPKIKKKKKSRETEGERI